MLYELLTGTTPFDTKELLKRGLDEVRRVVCNVEPPRPSTRLSTLTVADLTSVSRQRQVEPPRLIREVRGDLDWIAIKALEKDRERRYATVNGFAMDIRRYLAGEAILARPPSKVYRLRRLVFRHKLLFWAVCIALLLLVTCLIVTGRLLVQDRRMRNEIAVALAQNQGELLRSSTDWKGAADKFTEALRLQERFYGLDQTRAGQLLRAAVDCLSRAGSPEEANHLMDQYNTPALQRWVTHHADWLYWRGLIMAHQGRWHEARNDVATALEQGPHSFLFHALAPLLVAERDLPAYQQLCRQMVAYSGPTTNAMNADRVAKDCLILASSGVDLATIAALADTAVTVGRGEVPYTFYLCTKALADYRQGKLGEAVVRTAEILKDPFPYTQAEGSAVLAMAQFRLGKIEEAREALAKSETVVRERLPPPDGHDLGADWIDWIIAHVLLDEARSLIEGPSAANLDWRARSHE